MSQQGVSSWWCHFRGCVKRAPPNLAWIWPTLPTWESFLNNKHGPLSLAPFFLMQWATHFFHDFLCVSGIENCCKCVFLLFSCRSLFLRLCSYAQAWDQNYRSSHQRRNKNEAKKTWKWKRALKLLPWPRQRILWQIWSASFLWMEKEMEELERLKYVPLPLVFKLDGIRRKPPSCSSSQVQWNYSWMHGVVE